MDYKYTAIIIEPRKHKALEFVLNNICECLSSDWKIILFHGINNIEYIIEIVEKLNKIYENRIQYINLNIENLDLIEYSRLLCDKYIIYDNIKTELFLVFQTDSMIMKKNSELIDCFLEYDYIGSPWLIANYIPTKECDFIGNGGFSLRKKSKMIEIIEKIECVNKYEDLYFSRNYLNIKVNKPEYTKACTFCVDEVFSELTFACHKPWVHNHYELFKKIYPEVEVLKTLQDVVE